MDQVMRVVRQAGLRLAIIGTARALCVTLTGAVALLMILRIVERLGGFVVPWSDVALGVIVVACVGAIGWAFATRTRTLEAARALDERADLREALSTAICVQSSGDPWSKLIVQKAGERAEKVEVSKAIPFTLPRLAPVPLCAGLALAIVWFTVPRMDLWGVAAKRDQAVQEERRIEEVKTEFDQGKKKIEEMLSQANIKIDDGEGDKPGADREAPKSLEDLRLEAVRELTDLTDRLEQMRDGEKGQAMEAIKDRMGRLKPPGDEMNDMYRSMARGNFGEAQKNLEDIAKKLGENSDLTPEQKEQLKKQLENMSGQLSKLAQDRGELSKALEQAGMDGRLATDPEALKQAIEQAQNLTPEQQQQLQNMLQQAMAQQEMGDKMGSMADAMAKMAKGASEQGMSGEGMQGLEQLAETLSDMELAQAELDSLDAALSECRNQLAGQCEGLGECQGMGSGNPDGEPKIGEWKPGGDEQMGLGSGSGAAGRGNGNSPEEEAADIMFEKKKANVQTGAGPIIGTKLVQGSQIRGESVAEFSAVVEASSQAATEALETMQVRREYHDAVKHYFGKLDEKVKAERAGPPTSAPASGGGQ